MENWKPNMTVLMETETPENENETSRLFLISNILQPEVKTSKFLSPLQSDNSLVVLKLRSTDSTERGRGYWKFNNS